MKKYLIDCKKNIKCIVSLICVLCIIFSSATCLIMVSAAPEVLSRPDFTGNDNYILIDANENASVKLLPYGSNGIKSNLPTITGDFSGIPSEAEALVFYFDFTESVNNNGRKPYFKIKLNNSLNQTWTVDNSQTTVRIYTIYSNGMQTETLQAGNGRWSIAAGTCGYVVIPISEEILNSVIEGGYNLEKTTSITFPNGEWGWGKDFRNTTAHMRDLGYLKSIDSFADELSEVVDYGSVIDEIEKLNYPPTLEDSLAIQNVKNMYDKLFFKDRVTNYDRLIMVENAYSNLSNFQGVIDKIDEIGVVDENSFENICNAQYAYFMLDDTYKANVTNYSVLESALKDFSALVNAELLVDIIDSLPSDVTLDDQPKIELVRKIYNDLDVNQKVEVLNYDKLLEVEINFENLTFPKFYGDNYTVISKNEKADITFGEHPTYRGITENLPTLSADCSKISGDFEAIAFYFDFTDAVNTSATPPIFRLKLNSSDGKSWLLNSENVDFKSYAISENGITIGSLAAGDRYNPVAGSKGYNIITITEEVIQKMLEDDFDFYKVTSISINNGEWLYGADFRGSKASLRNFGYIKDVDTFYTDFINAMDISVISNGVEVLSSNMSIESKELIDSYISIYNNLIPSSKAMFKKYEKLLNVQLEYNKIIDVDGVIEKINSIGNIDVNSLDKLSDILNAYYILDKNLKSNVTNYSLFTESLAAFYKLQTAETVSTLIDSIPENITKEHYAQIVIARESYNSLISTEKDKVTNYELLQEKEDKLNQIIPFYYTAPGNYFVLNQNSNATVSYGGTPGPGQFSGSLPQLYGDCSFVPEDAEGIAFYFDFSDAVYEGNRPSLLQSMNLTSKGITVISAKRYNVYSMVDGEFKQNILENSRLQCDPLSYGYVVIPINDPYYADIDFSEIDSIKFSNPDWLYGNGFKGSTVHLRNFGYIKDLKEFQYGVRRMYLDGYLVELQPDGEIKLTMDKINADNVKISWDSLPSAHSYVVSVYDKNKMYYKGVAYRNRTETSVFELTPDTKYFIQIAALDKDGKVIAYSNSIGFTTLLENEETFVENLIDADDMKTKGYLIEGTSVTVFWDHIDGVEYYKLNLYTEDDNGKLHHIFSQNKSDAPFEVQLLLLKYNENYVAQLVAYDFSDSIIFAYQPDRFTLASESTYIAPEEDNNADKLVDSTDNIKNGWYETQTVYETEYETVLVDKEVAGKGKWVRKYDWVLNKTAIYTYIGLGVLGLMVVAGSVVLIVLLRRKKRLIGKK